MARQKVFCFMVSAWNDKGKILVSRDYDIGNHEVFYAADKALLAFAENLREVGLREQTVRITVDIALPKRWWVVQ